ncbi:MAG TPA: DUF4173 domain-containing protein [Pyrinomonadaceae bacterium]|nr:DUF4173 domain-containing protein [Pyrinomonadaceae bacterium]
MNDRTKTGLEILQIAGLVGLLGNILLRQMPWGLNAFLFVAAFVTALLMLTYRRRPELLTKNTLALAGAMVFFASMFLVRDAEELLVFDTLAILVIMGVLVLANFDVRAHVAGVAHYAAGFIWSGLTSVFGPIALLVGDIDWSGMPGNKFSRNAFSVVRGVAIALPLVLIFGGLFMAADAAFEGLVNRAVNFEIDTVISHVVVTIIFAWLTAGYFRGAIVPAIVTVPGAAGTVPNNEATGESVVAKVADAVEDPVVLPDNATIVEHINRSDPPNAETAEPKKKRDWQNFDSSAIPNVFTLGTVETVIILGLVDLLFLAFVALQVPYLFGGMELVQNTPDFKLADYARRGFGELVAVAALVLPMLLASHWLLRRDGGRAEKIFKILAGIQIALLFVIMASAAQRLLLLTGALGYGLTTIRFYPMIVMIWLAVVFVWFGATVLRGSRNHFAWGALWSAILIFAATNLMNPHAFIVRRNVDLMQQGREFDSWYNRSLSDDAIPALVEGFSSMNSDDRCYVASTLKQRLLDLEEDRDLRSWSWPRSHAIDLLRSEPGMTSQSAVADLCKVLAPPLIQPPPIVEARPEAPPPPPAPAARTPR